MGELIEHNDNGNTQPIRIGDAGTPLSLKVYQDIYHQITGRTEQIRKRYNDNILLEISDLEQLHHKILQLCDVHNVVARNESISVFHNKERKEQFTSFERFRTYNANTANPCVSIVLKYNFSIIPAGLQQPQTYAVTIRLTSRVAVLKQAEEEAPPFMRGRLISFITDNTAEVTIDYADYVIARGFVEAFDEWLAGCPTTPKKKWLHIARRWSHLIPGALRMTAVLTIVLFALFALSKPTSPVNTTEDLARFLAIYLGASFIIVSIISAAGDMIEEAIDTYPTLSYLKINRGDEKLIKEFQGKQNGAIIKFIVGAAISIILNIISSRLEKLL